MTNVNLPRRTVLRADGTTLTLPFLPPLDHAGGRSTQKLTFIQDVSAIVMRPEGHQPPPHPNKASQEMPHCRSCGVRQLTLSAMMFVDSLMQGLQSRKGLAWSRKRLAGKYTFSAIDSLRVTRWRNVIRDLPEADARQ